MFSTSSFSCLSISFPSLHSLVARVHVCMHDLSPFTVLTFCWISSFFKACPVPGQQIWASTIMAFSLSWNELLLWNNIQIFTHILPRGGLPPLTWWLVFAASPKLVNLNFFANQVESSRTPTPSARKGTYLHLFLLRQESTLVHLLSSFGQFLMLWNAFLVLLLLLLINLSSFSLFSVQENFSTSSFIYSSDSSLSQLALIKVSKDTFLESISQY